MTYKELKEKGITCDDYLKLLISKGYNTVQEVMESEILNVKK